MQWDDLEFAVRHSRDVRRRRSFWRWLRGWLPRVRIGEGFLP